MKLFSVLVIALISGSTQAQSFVNGSFEKGTASEECGYNLTNADINSQLEAVNAFGGYEAMDILVAGCIIESIANENFALGIANEPSKPENGEAIALELSETLTEGQEYEISFKVQAITKYGPQGNLLIGASAENKQFGTEVFNANTEDGKWITSTFKYTAAKDIKYITVKPVAGVKSWNIVDDFVIKKL